MAQKRIPAFGQVGNQVVDETLPQFGDGDGPDTEGGADSDSDPLSALSSLLTDGGQFQAPPAVSGGNRNAAVAGALRQKYGLGRDDGSISQADLESLDGFMRGNDVRDAVTKAVAPIDAKGAYDLQGEALKNQGALDTENLKGGYGLQDQALKNEGAMAVAGAKGSPSPFGSGGGEGNDQVDYWAKAALTDSSLLSKLPTAMKGAVAARMATMGDGGPQTPTNQQKQMSETANDLLDVIDRAGGWQGIQGLAQSLQSKGLYNPVIGPIRRFAAQHGAGSLLGVDDSTAQDVGYFNDVTDLLKSGLARAHAGARGAGNNDMANRFDTLLNGVGDFPTFVGQLQGIRTLLEQYASHTNPKYAQMVSPANDPYADPNYQPK